MSESTWLISIGAAEKEMPAANDASQVYELFTTKLGVPAQQAQLLIGEDAQLPKILQTLERFGSKGAGRQLVFYFAGDAETRDLPGGGQAGSLLLGTSNKNSEALSLQRLERVLRSLSLKSALIFVDAGVGGTGTRPLAVRDDSLALHGSALHLFVSAGRGETPSRQGSTSLAAQLRQALVESAADVDGNSLATATELGTYLVEALGILSEGRQHPYFRVFEEGRSEVRLPVPPRSEAPSLPAPPPVPDPGFLRVETDTAGAMISLDGVYVGATPLAGAPVPAGEGWVVIQKAGTESWAQSVYVQPGETLTLSPSFIASEGHLVLQGLPARAEVRINGDLLSRDDIAEPVLLPIGRYELEVQVSGEPDARRAVVVRPASSLVAEYQSSGFQSGYLLRSVAVPGWGQWADGRRGKAVALAGALIGTFALERWGYARFDEEREAYAIARSAYLSVTTEQDALRLRSAMEAQYDEVVGARNRHAAFVASVAGVYALNLLDAYFHHALRPVLVLRIP